MSVARTCVGASDYSTSAYSFDDGSGPDPGLKRFSIEHDRGYILPTLREAREQNPDLFLFSSPWSPPGWMKAGGSLLGGSMRREYFAAYAQYFVRFLQGYSAEGVRINAVTVQNEVDTDQNGRMPAALWGQEYEIEFVKRFLGPAFEHAALDTKIWILDHNYNLWGRAMGELSDPDLNKYVDGVAWHGYFGTPDAMTLVKEAFPTKHGYFTEGGPDLTDPNYATDWAKCSHTFSGILRNWARCIVSWNLVLDENGNPNIGPFHCGGVVTADSKTHKITRSGQYWAFAHYSKSVQRGARVIASHGDLAGIDHVAFENPDGSHVLVLTNQGAEQPIQCQMGIQSLDLTLEPDSVITLLF
jgi:glucosylceramidase